MYRILIVDDERHVLDWISELLVELDEPELDVYKAETVTEALGWLNRARIDIVVSDISMPGMNGMELHGRIRERWPECKVIFLTGYTDFEYAYQAVKNEAVGYILKTEDDDVIVDTVLKAVRMLEESKQGEQLLKQAEERMKAAVPVLRNEYLAGLLRGEVSSLEFRERQFRELGVVLDAEGPVLLVVARLDVRRSAEAGAPREPVLPIVVGCVTDSLHSRNATCAHVTVDGSLVWMIQFDRSADLDGAVTSKLLMETLDEVQSFCGDRLGQSLSSVMADGAVPWEQLADRYASLEQGLIRRMIYASSVMMLESGLSESRVQPSQSAPSFERVERNKWEALRICLVQGQRDRFMQLAGELDRHGSGSSVSLRDSGAMEAFGQFSLLLLTSINHWEMKELSADDALMDKLTNADRHASWEAAFGFCRHTANLIFDLLGEKRESGDRKVIDYLQEYISKHLHEGISLVELAELVYFSPSYLSRLFKESTGLSVTDYLANLRLERAVEMLREKRKVADIAASVGIESAAYFSRFFKKMTGRTPQEYREEILLNKS